MPISRVTSKGRAARRKPSFVKSPAKPQRPAPARKRRAAPAEPPKAKAQKPQPAKAGPKPKPPKAQQGGPPKPKASKARKPKAPKVRAQPAKARKPKPQQGKTPVKQRVATVRRREAALPGWQDLNKPGNERIQGRRQESRFATALSTTRFALLIVALATAFTVYVGHVHATQSLLGDLQEVRRDNLRLHMEYNRIKGAFDRATGPATIKQRARALGLVEGLVEGQAYGPTITIN